MTFNPMDIAKNAGAKDQEDLKVSDDQVVVTSKDTGEIHNIKVRSSFTKQDLEKQAWTPDKFVQDGQVTAGKVTPQHEEFLKTTEWVE